MILTSLEPGEQHRGKCLVASRYKNQSEAADAAGLSHGILSRALSGHPISRATASKVRA